MKITIVIPNFNGRSFLDDCLTSLSNQTCRDFQIIIVDNHSSDDSVPYLREHYPDIRLITLDRNYGFSRAVNEGIRAARTPYVLLLNNDTAAEPDFTSQLLRTIESSPRIFSVSSRMIQMKHPELLDSAGDIYTLMGWAVNRGVGRPADTYMEQEEVFSSCAGAAIYRTALFRKIGLFDENHFAYLEDIDICYRARIYGYKNMYCPSAVIRHVGSGTSGSRYNSFKVKLAARNSIYVIYKNMPLLQTILNFPALLAGFAVKYFFFVSRGFGTDYLAGLSAGLSTRERCRKVPFKLSHFHNYIDIELDLINNTVQYTSDYFSRKVLKR